MDYTKVIYFEMDKYGNFGHIVYTDLRETAIIPTIDIPNSFIKVNRSDRYSLVYYINMPELLKIEIDQLMKFIIIPDVSYKIGLVNLLSRTINDYKWNSKLDTLLNEKE